MRTERALSNKPVVRGYAETRHKAKSWSRERRAVARIEATPLGLDTRFVVTNVEYGAAEWIYAALYCARGQAENLIKLHKTQLASDRTSCRSAIANQVRLALHTAAYWLMLTVRDAIPKPHKAGHDDRRVGFLENAPAGVSSTTKAATGLSSNGWPTPRWIASCSSRPVPITGPSSACWPWRAFL